MQAIPEGFVRTYGDISPGAPRIAGAVLHNNDDPAIRWHRVVRADGSLAKGDEQRRRLESRGRSVPRFARRHAGGSDPRVLMWLQREIGLGARSRGFHLVTREVLDALPEIGGVGVGLLHLLIQHTSASLALNENASPDVRRDFETYFNEVVPEDARYWTHTLEGSDDMPAHIKAALLGPSLTLPVTRGELALGTWQGIYLCEHRNHGGSRSVVATLFGQSGE